MKRNDVILGAVVLVVALALLAFTKFQKVDGKQIEIYIADELYATKDLGKDDVVEIENGQDEVINEIVVEGGQAYMKKANCPDALCIKQGHIYMTKETIICLPNKVSVKVIGEVGDQIDAVVR